MAFGFFKKPQKADLILYNGAVITMNPECPNVSAIACKDGKIIATGDIENMEELKSIDTLTVDLENKYVLPGLIDIFSQPVTAVFKEKFLDLSGVSDMDTLLKKLGDWVSTHTEDEIIFGFGYSEKAAELNDENEKTITELLDSCCIDKPVILLCQSSVSCILNSCGENIVKETAEEEMVEYVTVPYVLNLFVPFDFEEIEKAVRKQLSDNISLGITASLSTGAADYFESLYQDSLISLYNENQLYQRFFGSYMINRPLIPAAVVHKLMMRKTMCNEINSMINAATLYISLNQSANPISFSSDALISIVSEAADKGFSIYITAAETKDIDIAGKALEYIRSKGYKNIFVIQSSATLDGSDMIHAESAYYLPPGEDFFHMNIADFIETVTATAAEIIKASDSIGSIEKGKFADFAIFDKDPLMMTPEELWLYPSQITVFNGKLFNITPEV